MTGVRFHPEAEAEYHAALDWYRGRSARAADRFEAELERTLGLVRSNPELPPAYDDTHRFAVLRRFPFSVVYQVLGEQIHVIALAHSSRAAGYWKDRGE